VKYLFDTNSCIHLLSGTYPALTARVAETEAGAIGISSISFAELALGTHIGKSPDRSLLDDFISEVPIQDFGEAAARAYARLPFRLANFDRLIAAHALSLGSILITHNRKDFADISHLITEDWTA